MGASQAHDRFFFTGKQLQHCLHGAQKCGFCANLSTRRIAQELSNAAGPVC